MNTVSTPNGGSPVAHDFPPDQAAISPGDVALSLQLCRASVMSLMRLQLAFERGDRAGAMEAIDRLHALDAEAERVLVDLPGGEDDPQRRTIAKTLSDEKMAIAFEKLALASGIDGPDIASPPPFLRRRDNLPLGVDTPDIDDDSPTGARLFAIARRYGARRLAAGHWDRDNRDGDGIVTAMPSVTTRSNSERCRGARYPLRQRFHLSGSQRFWQ